MNEFEDIDRELANAFAQRPSTLSRPSLRDVRNHARRRQRQRSAGLLGACAVVGVGGAAVLATRSPANQTTVGEGTGSTICFPTASTSLVYDSSTAPFNTVPMTTITYEGTYVVQAGDNPASVAAQFDVTLESLNAINATTQGYDTFQVGTEIFIPHHQSFGVPTTLSPDIASTYTIAAGDYPGSVAEMFGVTVAELDAINRDVPGYGGFIVGTVINIPPPSQVSATTTTNVMTTGVPQTTVFPEATAWTTTTMSINGESFVTVYHVQQGDTPEGVADAFDVTLLELDAANVDTPGYVEWLVGTAVRIPFQHPPETTAPVYTGPDVSNSVVYTDCFPVAVSTMPEPTVSTIVSDAVIDATTSSTIPSFTKVGTAIQILNCSNQEGVARNLSNALAAEGFTTVEPDTGAIDLPVTQVLYNPDDPYAYAVALTLSVYLGVLPVAPGDGPIPSLTGTWFAGSGVIVCLGDDLAGMTLAQIVSGANGYTGTTNVETSTTVA